MKLVTFIRSGSENEELGLLRGEGVLPLGEHGFSYADMNELIRSRRSVSSPRSRGRCRTCCVWG